MVDTMGFLSGMLTGNWGEDESQADQTVESSETETQEDSSTDNSDSLLTDEESKAKKKEREEYLSKTDGGRAGFSLHQGEIIETHTYDTIFSTSWNSDYEGMESSGSITIPFHKEDLQYIYKGVRCLLKTKRFNYDVTDEQIEIDDSEGYLCFITDVNISDDKLDLSLNGYEKLLEQENILSFTNQRRSTILEEVIKMAGFIPVIDTTGLPDERINWSTEKEDKKDKQTATGMGEASSQFTDCTTTYELCAEHRDTPSMETGYIAEDADNKTEYMATIGKQGTNYADYVKDCSTACDVVKKLRNGWGYRKYADNPYYKCVEQVFEHRDGINCADSAKLVKCCMDVIGVNCMIVHCKQGSAGHYFNNVKIDGKWYTVDLCFRSNIGKEGSTNTLGC